MEINIKKLCEEYLEIIENIRHRRLMTLTELARDIGFDYITLKRITRKPETCALKTLRKLRKYIDTFDDLQY